MVLSNEIHRYEYLCKILNNSEKSCTFAAENINIYYAGYQKYCDYRAR